MWSDKIWRKVENFIDLWIIDKFSILPTDNRFLDLYDEQKLALFYGMCFIPDKDYIKKHHAMEEIVEEAKHETIEDFEKKKAGLIDRMKVTFIAEGVDEKEIKKRIRKHLEKMKKAEIDRLEKMRDGK